MTIEPNQDKCPKRSNISARLGTLLVDLGIITKEQLNAASKKPTDSNGSSRLADRLVELGYTTRTEVTKALARLSGRTFVHVEQSMVDPECLGILPRTFLESNNILPLTTGDDRLVLAAEHFTDLILINEIAKRTGLSVVVLAATGDNIASVRSTIFERSSQILPATEPARDDELDKLFHDIDAEQLSVIEHEEDEADLEASASQSPVISLVNQIIKAAVRASASDIHIEPTETSFHVRFRVDGDLIAFAQPPHRLLAAVVSRIKIMAALDISERRLPQDGSISVNIGQRSIDLRVSTMTARFGEKVVIRIIERDERARDLAALGFMPDMLEQFRTILHQPNGIVLVTGPTGSGKTSTLYAALDEIVTGNNNVSTIEDPVERVLPGVNQFQVHPQAGFTFASAMRSMLRQDPDIIMVGEIRDPETARLATEAALTGHLVLSTLHTNDAPTAIPRLINMGVEPYLAAATLRGIIAQRLVKRNCIECNEPATLTDSQAAFIQHFHDGSLSTANFTRGTGCRACNSKGTRGRIGVYELLAFNEPQLCTLIRSLGSGAYEMPKSSPAFVHDGLMKACQGHISVNALMEIVTTLNSEHAEHSNQLRVAA